MDKFTEDMMNGEEDNNEKDIEDFANELENMSDGEDVR